MLNHQQLTKKIKKTSILKIKLIPQILQAITHKINHSRCQCLTLPQHIQSTNNNGNSNSSKDKQPTLLSLLVLLKMPTSKVMPRGLRLTKHPWVVVVDLLWALSRVITLQWWVEVMPTMHKGIGRLMVVVQEAKGMLKAMVAISKWENQVLREWTLTVEKQV